MTHSQNSIIQYKPMVAIAGKSGSGKTTLLNALKSEFPSALAISGGGILRAIVHRLIEAKDNLNSPNVGLIKYFLDNDPSLVLSDMNLGGEGYAQLSGKLMSNPQIQKLFIDYYANIAWQRVDCSAVFFDSHLEYGPVGRNSVVAFRLIAEPGIRAIRKWNDYKLKDPDVSLSSVIKSVESRDAGDAKRDGYNQNAIEIDTSKIPVNAVCDIAAGAIRDRLQILR